MLSNLEVRYLFHLNVVSFTYKCITLDLKVVKNDTIPMNRQRVEVLAGLIYL